MDLIAESFQRLFPNKTLQYQTQLEYNLRLSDFNSNIRLHRNLLSVHLNIQWKDIDDEIKIGLVQSLLLKILKEKVNSPNINLYHNFIKNIPILTLKTKSDPALEPSFLRVNEKFFQNQLEQPNLQWGQDSFRKLASYNYHDDTVTFSTLFTDAPVEILDYLMYHELLHKHLKFKAKNGRSSFHSTEFREAERQYPNFPQIEKQIQALIRKSRFSSRKSWWGLFS